MLHYRTIEEGKAVLHDASDLSKFDGKFTTADLSMRYSTTVRQWNEQYQEDDLETAYSLRAGCLKPNVGLNTRIADVFKEIWERDNFGLVEFYFTHNGIGYNSIIEHNNLGYSLRTSVDNQPAPSFIVDHNASLQMIVSKLSN